mmetsp:Transcript_22770/g.67793  ORF Transcript_22770/g.67793 Transcript_22770/m.67793 type:complete len:90 (-) Transcript_22770:1740-2009(-)
MAMLAQNLVGRPAGPMLVTCQDQKKENAAQRHRKCVRTGRQLQTRQTTRDSSHHQTAKAVKMSMARLMQVLAAWQQGATPEQQVRQKHQ